MTKKDINTDWKSEAEQWKAACMVAEEERKELKAERNNREIERKENCDEIKRLMIECDKAVERAANYEMDKHSAEKEHDKLKARHCLICLDKCLHMKSEIAEVLAKQALASKATEGK